MLEIAHVSKQFWNGFLAIDDVSFSVRSGEIISIVGTSGCGKSTLLRIIAGLDVPSIGTVSIDGEVITSPHSHVGIIFQEPRLMPWLTVERNIQFGLEHLPLSDKAEKTELALERVGLTRFSQALPHQLSGGMAQRAAIARALVTRPSILLLDEPFSALDAFTRVKLQDHVLKIWEYDCPTMILVTHDVEEALVLSDRIIVMRGHPGHIHQVFDISLKRPRKRTDIEFQHWKEKLLGALDLSVEEEPMLAEANGLSVLF